MKMDAICVDKSEKNRRKIKENQGNDKMYLE